MFVDSHFFVGEFVGRGDGGGRGSGRGSGKSEDAEWIGAGALFGG